MYPSLEAQGPIVLTLLPSGGERGLRITLHDWQPQALPYDGLPDTLAEAEERKRERFVVEEIDASEVPCPLAPPAEALTEHCFDLRRVPVT